MLRGEGRRGTRLTRTLLESTAQASASCCHTGKARKTGLFFAIAGAVALSLVSAFNSHDFPVLHNAMAFSFFGTVAISGFRG